ncbi:GNAT family N-acetyltransferase [Aestuariibius sp. HNIBRBA575]|uniref:GNAT family N-acetyltransferase n=1 Tax=Aestuariibius sp. HNIBRBA575 TaxID=3233343 RepID=UPI0034A56F17
MTAIDIVDLDCLGPDQRTQLAQIMTQAWPGWYGTAGQGDASADIAARAEGGDFPIGLAALIDGRAIGTVALSHQSFGQEAGETCWLTGLVVAPEHRGQGIAGRLVAAVADLAKRRGHASICTTTQSARSLLERQHWLHIRDVVDDDRAIWHVLSKSLAP